MKKIKNITQKTITTIKSISSSQLALGSAFAIALTAAVSLGTVNRQQTSALAIRMCNYGAISSADINGGCGALTAAELIADLRTNIPGDLQGIAANYQPGLGISAAQYDDVQARSKMGIAYRDGRLVVDGQVVMNNIWTMGRGAGSSRTTPFTIDGVGTYQRGPVGQLFVSDAIPTIVYFNNRGAVQYAAMTACSNPVGGDVVVPFANCNALNATATDPEVNPNTYTFTTDAQFGNNANLSRVVYTFSDDGSTVTTGSLSEPVKHTFRKTGTAKVTVYASVPGGSEIEATAIQCEKVITYVAPQYACSALVASITDDRRRKFRFTVKASHDKYTKLVSANFNLDTALSTGVTTKDGYGDIYQEYILDDGQTHKVVATVNFDSYEGKASVNCETTVTPAKKPMCTVPGKENLPPDSPDCVAPKVMGTNTVLPKTGIGSVAGIVAAAIFGGAVFHKVSIGRRHQSKRSA